MAVKYSNNHDMSDMKAAFNAAMMEIAEEDKRVVYLDSDLVMPNGMVPFQKKFPDRTIDCGIMEQNMNGLAAGVSARGLIPFTHTFACFVGRKTLDQIYLSSGFGELNVKFVGSDPGVDAMYNGASHMALEDMGILMNVPNLTLVEPSDKVMMNKIVHQIKDTYGIHYLRMNRKQAANLYADDMEFEIGKGIVYQDGDDVTIIASGREVYEAIKAAEMLKEEGISARVVDMFTWQPIDEELIIESAKKTGAVVVAENHRMTTGLAAQVALVLGANCPVPFGQIGIGKRYGEVGTLDYLMEVFKIRDVDIAAKVKEVVARK